MELHTLFATPLWVSENSLPEGAYDWALEYKKKNPNNVKISNRGGYQSTSKEWKDFKYNSYIQKILNKYSPFRNFKVTNWWLNVNGKGDYNLQHTHGNSDLSCIWYITNNENLLIFEDSLIHNRIPLYQSILNNFDDFPSKNINCSAGTLLIFPSDVPHRVEEHTLDSPRISISFNLSRKAGGDSY
tara:strand:- start:611 stop:1168 length:558 start_codon:yes stop_codon:yes gene_type:complete